MNAKNFSSLRVWCLASVLALSPIALLSGCLAVAAGAAGAGAVAYIRGELDASIGRNIDAVDTAASRAAEQLRFVKVSETADAISRVITLRTAEDKKIEIRLNRTTDALTHIRIRVGLFGDESLSRLVFDKIQSDL